MKLKFEDFKQMYDDAKEIDGIVDKLYDLGVDIVDSRLMEIAHETQNRLVRALYGDAGLDWFNWYVYERPMAVAGKEQGSPAAWDEDGNPMLNNLSELHAYLEELGADTGEKTTGTC